MVTRNFLDYLDELEPPSAVENYNYSQLFDDALADLQEALPDWNASEDSLLYRALSRIILRFYVMLERVNDNVRRSFLYYQTGDDLDQGAALVGITRNEGETDAQLKARIPLILHGQAVGTLSGVIAEAFQWRTDIVDANAIAGTDRQTISVAARKKHSDDDTIVPLTAEEMADLQLYLNAPHRVYIGATINVVAYTTQALTITAALVYDKEYDRNLLEDEITKNVYSYIDSINIGDPVNVSTIIDVLTLPGITNVSVTSPSTDQASNGTRLYTITKDATGVQLSFS